MKKVLFTLLVAVAWCAGTAVASAQAPVSQNLTVNATVGNRLTLTLTGGPVTFPDSDPATVLNIAATQPVTIAASARVASGRGLSLTCQANTDLTSGSDVIPIANVSWSTGGGPGYVSGAMSTAGAVPVGNWTGSGSRSDTQQFTLVNNWNYAIGTYSATVVYTLSAL